MDDKDKFGEIVLPPSIKIRRTTIPPIVQRELIKLFPHGLEQRILGNVLGERLPFLDQWLEKARTVKKSWFEHLTNGKGVESIYNIKNKELNNLRILYCIQDNHVYLLCAFCEKKGGDYSHYIETAQQRMKEIWRWT